MRTLACGAALALACGAASCGRTEAPAAARSVAASVVAVRVFSPPADGLVTDAQIDHLIAVRRAARGRTEADAARALAIDPDEHAWVRARVLEATVWLDERRVRTATAETYGRTIAALQQTRASVRDAATVRTLDEQIAALERERASWKKAETPTPALAANAKRVERRRAEIDAAGP